MTPMSPTTCQKLSDRHTEGDVESQNETATHLIGFGQVWRGWVENPGS